MPATFAEQVPAADFTNLMAFLLKQTVRAGETTGISNGATGRKRKRRQFPLNRSLALATGILESPAT